MHAGNDKSHSDGQRATGSRTAARCPRVLSHPQTAGAFFARGGPEQVAQDVKRNGVDGYVEQILASAYPHHTGRMHAFDKIEIIIVGGREVLEQGGGHHRLLLVVVLHFFGSF